MYKTNWIVKINVNGFKSAVMISGTEQELQAYIETELPCATSYRGATEDELEAAQALGLPVYCASSL